MIRWQRPDVSPGDTQIECYLYLGFDSEPKVVKRTWIPKLEYWISNDDRSENYYFGEQLVKAWMFVNDLPGPSWLDTRKLPGEK